MNKKYERYIDYIVNDLEIPYFFNMKEMYGLRPDEYEMILSKVFNQPVTIIVTIIDNRVYNRVYNKEGNVIYSETSDGDWRKYEYDSNDNEIYYENSDGFWVKSEYDANDNGIYYEDSNGEIEDYR